MPKRPPRPCSAPGCRKYAVKDGRCEDHYSNNNWNHNKNRHERGYGNAWTKLRNKALVRDGYLCQVCINEGILTKADAVDHKVPKSQGGTDSMDNLQSICDNCHKEKTQKESKNGRN